MKFNNLNIFPSQVKVEYDFAINRFEIITSHKAQRFLKLVFNVSNENENFDEDQLYLLDEDDNPHSSYYEFIEQLSQFEEIEDNHTVEDLIGKKGTCYFKSNFSGGKVYKKIVVTS